MAQQNKLSAAALVHRSKKACIAGELLLIVTVPLLLFCIIHYHQLTTYPQVEGYVAQAHTYETTDIDGDTEKNRIVTVVYTVDGTDYSQTLKNPRYAPEGKTIMLIYNPKDPTDVDESYAIGTFLVGSCLLALFSALLIFLIVLNFFTYRKRKKQLRQEWESQNAAPTAL